MSKAGQGKITLTCEDADLLVTHLKDVLGLAYGVGRPSSKYAERARVATRELTAIVNRVNGNRDDAKAKPDWRLIHENVLRRSLELAGHDAGLKLLPFA